MTETRKIAHLMRLQLVALGCAVDDLEAGHYSTEERHHLAGGLDTLAAALRGQEKPVVESERTGPEQRELRQRPGMIAWGTVS